MAFTLCGCFLFACGGVALFVSGLIYNDQSLPRASDCDYYAAEGCLSACGCTLCEDLHDVACVPPHLDDSCMGMNRTTSGFACSPTPYPLVASGVVAIVGLILCGVPTSLLLLGRYGCAWALRLIARRTMLELAPGGTDSTDECTGNAGDDHERDDDTVIVRSDDEDGCVDVSYMDSEEEEEDNGTGTGMVLQGVQ